MGNNPSKGILELWLCIISCVFCPAQEPAEQQGLGRGDHLTQQWKRRFWVQLTAQFAVCGYFYLFINWVQLPGGVPRFWEGRDVGEMIKKKKKKGQRFIISKPTGTWGILVSQDTAGPSRHNHGKMHPWWVASSFQDVPQVSNTKLLYQQKIASQRKYSPTTVMETS